MIVVTARSTGIVDIDGVVNIADVGSIINVGREARVIFVVIFIAEIVGVNLSQNMTAEHVILDFLAHSRHGWCGMLWVNNGAVTLDYYVASVY